MPSHTKWLYTAGVMALRWVLLASCIFMAKAQTTGTGTCPVLTTAQFTASPPTLLSFATGTGATAYTGLLAGLTLNTATSQPSATVTYTVTAGAVRAVGG